MATSALTDLRTFIEALRRDGELVQVDEPVDPALEIAEIHRRVIAAEGPALLFTNVRGADFPVVTNLFGTRGRAERAFGSRPFQLVRRAVDAVGDLMPPSVQGLLRARDLGRHLLSIGRRRVAPDRAPVAEVQTADVRLDRLPALTCWPEDGGPFITLPLVYTEHPLTGQHNLGMYRLQVHGRAATGMHWQIGKGGGFHYAVAEARGTPLPATVWLGGPPALILSAIAPLPENVPELALASLLLGERLAVVDGLGPHPVPARAEFALVGLVRPGVRAPEGPFGDHYGYYSLRHDYPVFEVERLYHRRDAIFPATVVGKPRQEDFYLGDLLQELLSPLFPLVMPGVRALWSYGETGYHSLAVAYVAQRYRREAMASAFRILGEGQLSLTKFLLVVDQPVDLKDFRATLVHVLERTVVERDLFVFSELSMDTLDYTGPAVNEGSKGVWLGLGDPVRTLPSDFRCAALPAGVTDVHVFCPGCLVVGGPSYEQEPGAPSRLVADPAFAEWMLIVLTDEPRRTVASVTNFLWTTFTRFEPGADLAAAGVRIVRNQVTHSPPVLMDARRKPGFPGELFADRATAATVSRRWRDYFPAGVEMGSSDDAHLAPVAGEPLAGGRS